MKRLALSFQLFFTLIVLAFVPNNVAKVCLLLPMWWLFFGGLTRREWIAFVVINFIFVASDIAAVQSGFFKFLQPDFLTIPWWEFFAWGFFLLHTHRMLPLKRPKALEFRLGALAIAFAAVFWLIADRTILLYTTCGILILTLVLYREKEDLIYCGYLMMIGALVEYVGLTYGLWMYPGSDYQTASVQFLVMWGAAGVFFRHIFVGWLTESLARKSA